MIVITGHSDGGDGILYVSQLNDQQAAIEELRVKIGGTLAKGVLEDDPDEEVDILLEEGKTLNDDLTAPRHGAWELNASPINEEGFGHASW